MRVLLDTHAFLWFASGNPKISDSAVATITDSSHEIFLSLASLWEIGIKTSIGKLELLATIDELVDDARHEGIELLPIEVQHVIRISELPFHHRDPFDRMLVAQALESNLQLISCDVSLDAYGVIRLWD